MTVDGSQHSPLTKTQKGEVHCDSPEQVQYSAKKAELKQLLSAELVEQGVLPKSAAADAAAGDTASDAPMAEVKVAEAAGIFAAGVELGPVTDPLMGTMTTEDLRIALQIKEAETRNKQQEVQAMHLRVGFINTASPPLKPTELLPEPEPPRKTANPVCFLWTTVS
ncbi:delta-like protein B [Scomber scombrus]|uniref:Delta-like protein B n=1 Tax=Scomber scombrus TaxID=13677 RepID=A0AAV1Q3A2_SCOSC